jgi:cell division septation protein DedD
MRILDETDWKELQAPLLRTAPRGTDRGARPFELNAKGGIRHLTIWELLDGLEIEISRLRTRIQELERQRMANGQLELSLSPVPVATRRSQRRKPPTKQKRKGGAKKAKSRTQIQPELIEETAAATSEGKTRITGKRQALGKSLLQLRKASTARVQEPETPA